MKRDLPREQLQALVNLSRSADGKQLLDIFEAERADAQSLLESANEDTLLRRAQGKAIFLKQFLERVRDASELLEKMKR